MFGVGVIGVGVWGCHSLEQTLLATGRARVTAVSTADRWGATQGDGVSRGASYAQELGAVFIEDWREVIRRDDVDIVSVMVCPARKAEVIEAALRWGKHVVTDKPLAMTVEEAERILATENSSAGRGFLLAGYHRRSPVRELCERIHAGAFGQLRAVSIRLCFMGGMFPGFRPTPRWRSEVPSGALTTIGSHALMTLFKFLACDPIRIHGFMGNRFYPEYAAVGAEDWAEVQVLFRGGAVGSIVVARLPYRVPGEEMVIEVTGTRGYAELSGARLTLWPRGETMAATMTPGAALEAQFQDCLDAFAGGTEPPTTFADGVLLQRGLSAAIANHDSLTSVPR